MVLLNYLSMQNYANKMLFFEYKWLVQISNSLIGHSKICKILEHLLLNDNPRVV